MWRALEAGSFWEEREAQARHVLDLTYLTTHGQQLRAYRTYEELLLRLPHQLQEPDTNWALQTPFSTCLRPSRRLI